jgi:hypothetical protein
MTYESPCHSWNLIGPCVVLAEKLGMVAPSLIFLRIPTATNCLWTAVDCCRSSEGLTLYRDWQKQHYHLRHAACVYLPVQWCLDMLSFTCITQHMKLDRVPTPDRLSNQVSWSFLPMIMFLFLLRIIILSWLLNDAIC